MEVGIGCVVLLWSERDYVTSAAQRDGRRSCAASRTGSGNVTDVRLKPLRPRQSPTYRRRQQGAFT